MSNKQEIKPCPFCGSEARLSETEGGDSVVHCSDCEAFFCDDMKWGEDGYDADANVIAKWNTRQPNKQPKPCHKDRACTFKDLKPCDDCEVGGDKELVEVLERIVARHDTSIHKPLPGELAWCMWQDAKHILAKHKAKNN